MMQIEHVDRARMVLMRKCVNGQEFLWDNMLYIRTDSSRDGNILCARLADGHMIGMSGDRMVRLVAAHLRWAATEAELEIGQESK